MGNSSSSRKVSAQDKAILDLKLQRDKLHQYQRRITVITDREREIAKYHLSRNDRKRALLALRKKKYQESLLEKTDQQLASLELLTADVEFALVQKDVFFGLQRGTEVLKEIRKEMGGIDNVEKLMGESQEEVEYQREIAEILSGTMTAQEEDEVEEELSALEGRNAEQWPTVPNQKTGNKQTLPSVPTKQPGETVAEAETQEPDRVLLPA